jgi:hypothetical protein
LLAPEQDVKADKTPTDELGDQDPDIHGFFHRGPPPHDNTRPWIPRLHHLKPEGSIARLFAVKTLFPQPLKGRIIEVGEEDAGTLDHRDGAARRCNLSGDIPCFLGVRVSGDIRRGFLQSPRP